MFKHLGLAIASSIFVLAGALPANAQDKSKPAPEPEASEAPAESDKVELDEDGVAKESDEDSYDFDSSDGSAENPNDPSSTFSAGESADDAPKEQASSAQVGYPIKAIDRPLSLPGGTSEVALRLPVRVDPFAAGASLRGTYGITDKAQVGLRYGMGALSKDGFEVGKAVSLDLQYLVTDNIAGQISIPMFLDPLAVGLVLGAPMKFTFFDSFSLLFGEDIVSIKLSEFIPSIDNAGQNAGFIAARAANTITPAWIGTASVRGIYQLKEKMAIDLQFGTQFDDSERATTTLMNVGVLHVHKENLDFSARLGATDLSAFVESLSLTLGANFRI